LVLIGTNDTTPNSEPEIKAELQNRSVISVAVGDWHNAALTSDGKVLTWGEFSAGALGLGDPGKLEPGTPGGYAPSADGRRRRTPPTVDMPTQVRFDHGVKEPRDRFAFAITAAGWHTGALVMDLDVGLEL
jgi:SCF-associated factor 1